MKSRLFSLQGRTAVVIGGTSGISSTISIAFSDTDAEVVATARSQDRVGEMADKIEPRGRKILRMVCDVCDRDSLERLQAITVEQFGAVDILVNCAARIKRAPTVAFSEQEWIGILNTNLNGTFPACQVFGKHMLEREYGRIINVASLNSLVALSEVAAYAASKTAVVSLTRSLAVEWSRKGVTVNAIAPGIVRTDINVSLLNNTAREQELLMGTPIGRFGNAEELVGTAIYLSSNYASFVTGQILAADGGLLACGVSQ